MKTLVIVSDIHHAGAAEQARRHFESRSIPNLFQRCLAQSYRHLVWMSDPLGHVKQLDTFLAAAGEPDLVVGNGDFSVDSGFIGLADEAVLESVQECLGKLRARFGERFLSVIGDHELGKMNLFGGAGGLRLASYDRAIGDAGMKRFWRMELGVYVLLAITSSLVALPIYEPEILAEEHSSWEALRAAHLEEIRQAFAELKPRQRILLFCHDPTALPFLAQEEVVRRRLGQIEHTIIGHLHSNFILGQARLLSGMPPLTFLGNTVRRYSAALCRAREWQPFRLLLCPSISGIQLLKDGGFLRLELDPDGGRPLGHTIQRLPWPTR
ncbi:MAG: metallophosphoesterase [Verrucomicrobia bacterium]|nr:metallophosphoesterase [Verrucomicrobiota bacterium]